MDYFQPPDPPEPLSPEDMPTGRTFDDRAQWRAYAEGREDELEEWLCVLEPLKEVLYHFSDPSMEWICPAAFAKAKAAEAAFARITGITSA